MHSKTTLLAIAVAALLTVGTLAAYFTTLRRQKVLIVKKVHRSERDESHRYLLYTSVGDLYVAEDYFNSISEGEKVSADEVAKAVISVKLSTSRSMNNK